MVGHPPPAWRPPAPAGATPVRWGIPDAVFVWVAGLIGSVLAAIVAFGVTGGDAGTDDTAVFAALVVGQYAAMFLALVVISRAKGRGTLAADFGLRIDLARDWWLIAAGAGLQIGANVLMAPILWLADRDDAAQDVVQRLEDAGGLELAVTAVAAALLAPVLEEILFRGLLLRALQRRMAPPAAIAVSALVFAAVHLVDPGAFLVIPGLVAVGIVAGMLAVRTGSLSQPILLHLGFNAIVVVLILAAGSG